MLRTARWLAGFVVMGLLLALSAGLAQDKPKHTIKDVMKEAHKDGLMKKVTGGKGTKEDSEKLHELYKALAENKPPKGDEKGWKDKTDPMVKLAKSVVDGDKEAGGKLAKTVNCMGCHKEHRP